jgi:hypothetical protein
MAEQGFEFEFHPAANLFPLLEGRDFDLLVADIEAQGLREPITLLGTAILDGRNRYRACQRAGVEPRFEQWKPRHQGDTPVAFVLSHNVQQRPLNQSQRAMLAARLIELFDRSQSDSKELAATQIDVAKQQRVGRASVQRATVILKKGSQQLIAAVERGKIPVSSAAKLAVLPKADQIEIATASDPNRTAHQRLQQLDSAARDSETIQRVIEKLNAKLEKIPSVEIKQSSSRVLSYEHREQVVQTIRRAGKRLMDLANQVEEPNLCAYLYCRIGYGMTRNKHAPDQMYCSQLCAIRAGGRWP